MTPDRPTPPDNDGRIVPFRPRGNAQHGRYERWRWPLRGRRHGDPPVENLAKYERGESEDDYRHRMKMNVLAGLVTIVLVVSGVWLANKIAEMRKNQDCYLSGRRNCTPIDIRPIERG